MLIIAIITALFGGFFFCISLIHSKHEYNLIQWTTWFLFSILIGWLIVAFLAFFMHLKAVLLLTGLVVLISGFRWLGLLEKDFFSLFRNSTFLKIGRLSDSFSIYFAGLAAMAQLKPGSIGLHQFVWVTLTNLLLAGFLLFLCWKKKILQNNYWLQELILIESGLYLTIMGLIIMGNDVLFFITQLEKILHI